MLFKVRYAIPTSDHFQQFYLKTCCFYDAVEEATGHIIEEVGEEYELLSIKALLNFVEKEEEPDVLVDPNKGHCHICNADYEGKGSCPFCSMKDCNPMLIMNIVCKKCHYNFKALGNKWVAVFCPKCNERIENFGVESK